MVSQSSATEGEYPNLSRQNQILRLCWIHVGSAWQSHRRLLIGRDGDLDQSEAYDLS